mgnify:CR=1 FL=1
MPFHVSCALLVAWNDFICLSREKKSSKEGEPDIKERRSEVFCSYEESLSVPLVEIRRVSKPLVAARYLRLVRETAEAQNMTTQEIDHATLLREFLLAQGLSEGFLGDYLEVVLQSSFGVHFNPVCAVVGGFLAQDIIKFLTHKDIPTNNYFLYDGLETHGALIEEVQPTSVA